MSEHEFGVDIAERQSAEQAGKQAEQAQRRMDELFRALIENALDVITILDVEGVIRYQSPSVERVLGYKPAELIGVNIVELLHPDDVSKVNAAIKAAAPPNGTPGIAQIVEARLRHKDGSWRLLEAIGKALPSGLPVTGIVVNSRDITERKRAEEALRESEEKYRNLVERANDGITIIQDTIVKYLNPRLAEMWGGTTEEVIGTPFTNYVHPDELLTVVDRYKRRVAGEDVIPIYETVLRHKDGSKVYAELNAGVITYQGKPADLVVVRDITERKRAEEVLRESEEKLKEAQALGRIGNWEFDIDNQKIDWSDETYRLYERDPAFGPPTVEEEAAYYSPEQVEILREYTRRAIEEGEEFEYDLQAKLPSGKPAHFSATMRPVKDESGRIVKLFGTVQDITERKRAEEELRASEQRYRLLFERNLAGVYRSTLDGRILDCNESYARIFGYDSQEEVLALRASELYFDAADRETFIAQLREQGTLTNSEWCLRRKDNSPVWVLENASLIEGEEGAPTFIQGTLVDITERKRAEEELLQRQLRLSALNRMGRALAETFELVRIYRIAYEHVAQLVDCPCFGISLYDPPTRTLRAEFMLDDGELIDAARFPPLVMGIEQPMQGRARAIVTRQPEIITDYPAVLEKATDSGVRVGVSEDVHDTGAAMYVPMVARGQVIGLLEVQSYRLNAYSAEHAALLGPAANQIGLSIQNARLYEEAQQQLAERKQAQEELRHTAETLRRTLGATIQAMAFTVETRDPYTAGHQRQVANLARAIGTEMGLSKEQVEGIRMAAVIHDMGKITVPTDILNKPGRLNEHEFGIIKAHPEVAYNILKTIEFPWPLAQIIFQHHERMDGSGYPQGLSGEEIIVEARVLAVADVVEAMASHRPYRPAHGIDRALEEISQNRGVLFDPETVDVCLKLFIEKGFRFE